MTFPSSGPPARLLPPVAPPVGHLFVQHARSQLTPDRSAVRPPSNTRQAGGGTAPADALLLSLKTIATVPPGADGKAAPAAIVLMSDGSPTIGHNGASPSQSVDDASAAAK